MIRRRARSGFTIVEAALSTVVVGVMLVAALQTVASSRAGQYRNAGTARGVFLGASLLTEITAQAYEDPALPPGSFGTLVTEDTGTRRKFDDVDDYHNWSESPPREKDGTVIPGFDGWSRSVRVRWVNPSNPSVVSLVDTRAKLIEVAVEWRGVPVVRLHAVRTAAR
jgi:type II secretory pathway pseudopilin PulG